MVVRLVKRARPLGKRPKNWQNQKKILIGFYAAQHRIKNHIFKPNYALSDLWRIGVLALPALQILSTHSENDVS